MSQQDVWDSEDAEMRKIFAAKDSEIERLRAAYYSSQATVLKYWEQRNEDHKLITDLADVLESYGFDELLDLIRRAREATRKT